MSGYLLPRAHLRRLGVDLGAVLLAEKLAGSFEACLAEVIEGDADITACFSAAAQAARPRAGYAELLGPRAAELRVLAYTAECPTDGIVLSPRLAPDAAAELAEALRRLLEVRPSAKQLAALFDVDGFAEATPGAFRGVADLI